MRPAFYCDVLVKLCRIGGRAADPTRVPSVRRVAPPRQPRAPAEPPYLDIETVVSSPFHVAGRAPVQLLRDRPSRYRDDDVPVPELRQVHDRAMRAVPRPVR